MCLVTLLYTKFCGTFVGQDLLGNKYYKGKTKRWCGKEKRWVLYKDDKNLVANLDPLWFKWLHYLTIEPPMKSSNKAFMRGTTDYDKRALYELYNEKRQVKLWKYTKKDAKRKN
jgi:NADH:ubiquinone oxidoreductase subunit